MKKLSVFMPCYNAEKYLGQAIESILSQTYSQFELVILDDGSTDNSRQIVEGYAKRDSRIKLFLNEENKGLVYTRNRGIALCESEYVALMDADDLAPSNRLQSELLFLENNPDIGAVGGRYQLIDENNSIINTKYPAVFTKSEIRAAMFFRNVIANGSVMYRTSVVKEYALTYQENFKAMEDYRFWCDFLQYSDIVNLDEVLQLYRVHVDSHERQTGKEQAERRKQLMDIVHQDLLKDAGIQLEEEAEKIYLAAVNENTKLGIMDRIHLGSAVVQIIKQSKSKVYYPEIRKMGFKFVIKNSI